MGQQKVCNQDNKVLLQPILSGGIMRIKILQAFRKPSVAERSVWLEAQFASFTSLSVNLILLDMRNTSAYSSCVILAEKIHACVYGAALTVSSVSQCWGLSDTRTQWKDFRTGAICSVSQVLVRMQASTAVW